MTDDQDLVEREAERLDTLKHNFTRRTGHERSERDQAAVPALDKAKAALVCSDHPYCVCGDWEPDERCDSHCSRATNTSDRSPDSPVDLGEPPYPGSDAALQAGCRCPVLDNGHGNTGLARDRGGWLVVVGCPMHCPVLDTDEPKGTPDG